jgi:hypothetical protein
MADPVIIVVSPVGRGKFSARLDGGPELVPASGTPFLSGCRNLLNLGYDPSQRAVTRHLGADYDALSATIGAAAKLTVQDDGAPRFRRWKPLLPREGSLGSAPNKVAATHTFPVSLRASHGGSPTRPSPDEQPPSERR